MKRIIALLVLALPLVTLAQLNGALLLSGRVVGENHEGLAGASISIKGTSIGTSSDSTGKFSMVINQKLPFTIIVSSIGFAPQELEVKSTNTKLAIQLTSQTFLANEVVVTASRTSEKNIKISSKHREAGSESIERNACCIFLRCTRQCKRCTVNHIINNF